MISNEKILTHLLGHILKPTGFDNERKLALHEMVGCIILLCSKANITFLEYIKLEDCPNLLKLIYNELIGNEYYKKYIESINIISKYNTLINVKETYRETWERTHNVFNYYLTDLIEIDATEESCIRKIKDITNITSILEIDAAYKLLENKLPNHKYKYKCSTFYNDIFFFSHKDIPGNSKVPFGKGSETKENNQCFSYKLKCLKIISTQYDTEDALYNLSIDCNGMIFIDSENIEGKISVDDFVNIYNDVFEFNRFIITYNDEHPITEKGFYSILNLLLNTMKDNRIIIKLYNVKLPNDLNILGSKIEFTNDELESIHEKHISKDKIKLIKLKEEYLPTAKNLLFFNNNNFSNNYFFKNEIKTEKSWISTLASQGILFTENCNDISIFILGYSEYKSKSKNIIDALAL